MEAARLRRMPPSMRPSTRFISLHLLPLSKASNSAVDARRRIPS